MQLGSESQKAAHFGQLTWWELLCGWLLLQFQWRGRLVLFVGWLGLQGHRYRWRRLKHASEHGRGWHAVVAAENTVWCIGIRARISRMEMCEHNTVVRVIDDKGATHYDVVPLAVADTLSMRGAHVRAIDIAALQREHEYYLRIASLATHPALPAPAQRRTAQQRIEEQPTADDIARQTRPIEVIAAAQVAAAQVAAKGGQ